MSLKNLLKMPKLVSRRLRAGRQIRAFDHQTDILGTYDRSGLADGYLKSKIDHVLCSPGLTERMINSPLHVRPDETSGAFYNWTIPAFLWDAILKSQTLNSMVSAYLGPRVRLDDLYVKSVTDGLDSISEGWHDDNVGYRLKVFMVFDVEGEPAPTLLVPSSRPNLYRVNAWDELSRFLLKPKTDDRGRSVRISYEKGDCLVFDTNVTHRGDYSSTSGVRYCVIAEFIDRDKADALNGRAPCGPGQGRRQIRIPSIEGVDLMRHPLLDRSLLRVDPQGAMYGYPKA